MVGHESTPTLHCILLCPFPSYFVVPADTQRERDEGWLERSENVSGLCAILHRKSPGRLLLPQLLLRGNTMPGSYSEHAGRFQKHFCGHFTPTRFTALEPALCSSTVWDPNSAGFLLFPGGCCSLSTAYDCLHHFTDLPFSLDNSEFRTLFDWSSQRRSRTY